VEVTSLRSSSYSVSYVCSLLGAVCTSWCFAGFEEPKYLDEKIGDFFGSGSPASIVQSLQ
jgi:hypothetical protein